MKIQCDVCERAEAEVLCCADEAVLCRRCDDKVHAANKLALKHHRAFLLNHHHLPLCDICQERNGYLFCLEDRALLCRHCDQSIHVAGKLSHQRFLIAGTKVSLESAPNCSAEDHKINSTSHEMAVATSTTSTCALPPPQSLWPLDDILGLDFDYCNDISDMASSRIDS